MFHDQNLNNLQTEELAQMGADAIAYMREMTGCEIKAIFPKMEELEEAENYWALFGTDGTPLVLATERADIASSAFDYNLKAVMPH